MTHFTEVQPTLENYWRSIILFGRNVASYKFALGKSLLELSLQRKESVSLEELAEPFARHMCEHLSNAAKQATSTSSRFLNTCRRFNVGDIKKEELLDATAVGRCPVMLNDGNQHRRVSSENATSTAPVSELCVAPMKSFG